MTQGRGRTVRSPQDLAAGLFLVAVALVALWQGADLPAGSLSQMGPGMLPRALAVLTGICGLAIAIGSLRWDGPALERWSLRGPLFILGAIVIFGLAVRPLGLAVAGPLALAVGALAGGETRLVETLVFAVLLTLFCLGLFVVMLGLPIPIAPWLIGR
ncbi:MAG: tripartite tricarboxylate transporter TctB family protein [Alphaproteobacteria bacterium]|nr:tripartite tricarboxylate transporter TctB family protein [Alphaproteobacteria bacterium]